MYPMNPRLRHESLLQLDISDYMELRHESLAAAL